MRIFLLMMALCGLTACQSAHEVMSIQHPAGQHKHTLVKSKQSMKNNVFVSAYSFDETVNKIEQGVAAKGMTVFAVIDHQEAAQKAGLSMQPAKVIVFGTPKAGTPLMVKDPHFALQLPLRVLVTQNDAKVQVVMTDPHELIDGSRIDYTQIENSLAKATTVIEQLIK